MRKAVFRILACASLGFLPFAGCLDSKDEETGAARLYVYDEASHTVLSWEDIGAIYDGGAANAADRTLSSTTFSSLTLGAGGMALDTYNQYLYLVSSTGTVVRISRVSQQTGSISAGDVISFRLDDAGTDAVGGTFGQAAVNPLGDTLYVTEALGTSKTQIWSVPVSLMYDGATIKESSGSNLIIGDTTTTGDTSGTGVAASSSFVFGYFDAGAVLSSGGVDYNAARLRRGTSLGFDKWANVIIGETDNATTQLGAYGSLAYDADNDRLYVARHNTDASATGNPLLAFEPGQFSPGWEIAPARTYAGPSNLRVIAHAGRQDWLVGGLSPASNNLWIWKGPSSGDASMSVTLPDTGSGAVQITGLALDGSD